MAFWERMEKMFSKGIEASKDVIDKAREKAKEMGEKGVLKFELIQLEKEAQRALAKLGSKAYELIESKKEINLPEDSQEFTDLCQEVHIIKEKIEDAEEKLKDV